MSNSFLAVCLSTLFSFSVSGLFVCKYTTRMDRLVKFHSAVEICKNLSVIRTGKMNLTFIAIWLYFVQ
jgi:hypothetical protein